MTTITYKAADIVNCPWCSKPSDSAAEDMVVQGPHAIAFHRYVNDCGWCDRLFTVEKISADQYEVRVTSGTIDDIR